MQTGIALEVAESGKAHQEEERKEKRGEKYYIRDDALLYEQDGGLIYMYVACRLCLSFVQSLGVPVMVVEWEGV